MSELLYFSNDELDLIRQWYDSIEDTNKSFLDDKDRELLKKIILMKSYKFTNKFQLILDWCNKNIDDGTQVSNFASQIRDLLENKYDN